MRSTPHSHSMSRYTKCGKTMTLVISLPATCRSWTHSKPTLLPRRSIPFVYVWHSTTVEKKISDTFFYCVNFHNISFYNQPVLIVQKSLGLKMKAILSALPDTAGRTDDNLVYIMRMKYPYFWNYSYMALKLLPN